MGKKHLDLDQIFSVFVHFVVFKESETFVLLLSCRRKGDKNGGTPNLQMDVTNKVPTFERKYQKYFWNIIYGRMFNGKCYES